MAQYADLEYFISYEGESYPLSDNLTVGRHLDNDVVCAGEDVLDYHLRIEPSERGPKVHPLGEASLTVNDAVCGHVQGLVAGDVLQVGQSELTVSVKRRGQPEADEWWLYANGEDGVYRIDGSLLIGRGENSDILLLDDHISRSHARLKSQDGVVWIVDLGSANGTFVNGERLQGGCRLYHGDTVSFDALTFQLVGEGPELTPVRKQEAVNVTPIIKETPAQVNRDTTEMVAVQSSDGEAIQVPDSKETGAFLLGASEPVSGLTFRTPMGRTIIGRSEEADVIIRDPTVSQRHAEIIIRPEGCTVTNLMATNGTRVNGTEVQSATLDDGDFLRLGRVSLVYKDVPVAADARPAIQRAQWWLLGGCGLLALALVGLLLL